MREFCINGLTAAQKKFMGFIFGSLLISSEYHCFKEPTVASVHMLEPRG
jgi:hypothetical protein